MELKIWVNGIQKEVCGVEYNTTCREVVQTLAHALHRTGKFTLVEKWRESERPLAPAECPLVSLHKWGEYASEVKLYLIHAEASSGHNKPQTKQNGKLEEFINKISKENMSKNPQGCNSLKRSLTFNGVNILGPVKHASSKFQGNKSITMQYQSSADRYLRVPNGDANLAKNSSNNNAFQNSFKQIDTLHSPQGIVLKPSSVGETNRSNGARQLTFSDTNKSDVRTHHPVNISSVAGPHRPAAIHHHPAFAKDRKGNYTGDGTDAPSVFPQAETNIGDTRELHPANLPGYLSPYSHNKTLSHEKGPHPFPRSLENENSSSLSHIAHHPLIQPSHRPLISPAVPRSNIDRKPAPTPVVRQLQPSAISWQSSYPGGHIPSSHNTASVPSQPQHPLSSHSHESDHPTSHINQPIAHINQIHSLAQPNLPTSHQPHLPTSHSYQPPTPSNGLPQPYQPTSHSSRPPTKQRPLPAPRQPQKIQASTEPSDTQPPEKAFLMPLPQQRSKERINPRGTQPTNNIEQLHTIPLNAHNNKWPPLDDSFYHTDDNDNKYPKPSSIKPSRRIIEAKVSDFNDAVNTNNNSNTEVTVKTAEVIRNPDGATGYAYKSSTIERSVSRKNRAPPAPVRSLSTEDNKPDKDPQSTSISQHKLNFVDSALKKQPKPNSDHPKVGAMSTFASAVAHIRQRSADGLLSPKTDHFRQRSSDESHSGSLFLPGHEPSGASTLGSISAQGKSTIRQSATGDSTDSHLASSQSSSGQSSQLSSHHHNLSPPLDNAPPKSFSPISLSRVSSAFKEVSPRSNHQGSPSPLSAPVSFSLDQPSFSTFGIGLPPPRPPAEGNHSRQPSVEIEEYDLDTNFPDVFHNDLGSSASKGVNIPLEYSLESGSVTPVKSESEYSQLVRLVKMQQEKLQMQEAKLNDTESDLTNLETQNSQNFSDYTTEELHTLEKLELEGKKELQELEKVEWGNIISEEKKVEINIRQQISKLKQKIDDMDSKLKNIKREEENMNKEIVQEKEAAEMKKKVSDEVASEILQLKDKLSALNSTAQESDIKIRDLTDAISKVEESMQEKEKDEEMIKKKLNELQADDENPLKISLPSALHSAKHITASPTGNSPTLSASDNGEAIIKILEGRLSPHLGLDGVLLEGQGKLKSPMATKNPNGVWV